MIAGKRNAGHLWHGSSIREKILENPYYTGNLVQQRKTTISVTSEKRLIVQIILLLNIHTIQLFQNKILI